MCESDPRLCSDFRPNAEVMNIQHPSVIFAANPYKAKRLLDKAKTLGAKPEHLVTKAIDNMASGKLTLLSDEDRNQIYGNTSSSYYLMGFDGGSNHINIEQSIIFF